MDLHWTVIACLLLATLATAWIALALFAATWISLLTFPPLHLAAKRLLGARAPLWFAGWLVTWLAGLLLSV